MMSIFTNELQRTYLRIFAKSKVIRVSQRQLQSNPKEKPRKEQVSEVINTKKDVIISCKRPEFNLYHGQKFDKFKPISLASKGWLHKKSKEDFFVINKIDKGCFTEEKVNVSFEEIGLDPSLTNVLSRLGFTAPTEVQKGIPSILFGRNTILAAETGCGKTLSYLLPIMNHILKWKKNMENTPMNCPIAVVISPNRELAHQIHEAMRAFTDELQISSKVIVGGHTKKMMLNPDFNDVDILIGTLGAISKLTTAGIYNMSFVRHIVLDEADSLLDDSFIEKLNYFLKRFSFNNRTNHSSGLYPTGVQLTLASATMPRGATDALAPNLPKESLVSIKTKNLHRIPTNVTQRFIRLGQSQKPGELIKLIKRKKHISTIIFSTKTETSQWLSMFLNENGISCINLNGEMTVAAREGKFADFQKGVADVISCTDIGSRGLNTVKVDHVLNYEFPLHIADYIHRCGRTGRLGNSSECLVTNFISGPREIELVQKIELAARNRSELPNVNGNIKRLITYKTSSRRHS